MTCAICDGLRAENRQLREDLDAWEGRAALDLRDQDRVSSIVRWMTAFGLSAGNAMVLLSLVERPGVTWSRASLLDVVADAPASHGEEASDRAIDTRIKKIRRAITRRLGGDPIKAHYGLGYVIDPRAAAWLKAMAEADHA